MHVEQLARSLTTLSNAVQGIEMRQSVLDERVAEFSSLVQGLQERQNTLADRQDMVADMAASSMMQCKRQENTETPSTPKSASAAGGKSGSDAKLCESRLDDQERRLTKLSVDVTLLASRVAGTRALDLDTGGPKVSKESGVLAERLTELEKGQRKVVTSAQRALKMAMGLQQQQRHQLQQQESLDKLMSDSHSQPDLETASLAQRLEEQSRTVEELHRNFDGLESLRDHVEELHRALLCNLASQQLHSGGTGDLNVAGSQLGSHTPTSQFSEQGTRCDGLSVTLKAVQAKVDRSLSDMSRRLDLMQEVKDQQRVQNWQVSRQVPDMAQRIDQLWAQCQFYFSKIKEHDVHIGFLCNNTESDHLVGIEFGEQSSKLELPAGPQQPKAICDGPQDLPKRPESWEQETKVLPNRPPLTLPALPGPAAVAQMSAASRAPPTPEVSIDAGLASSVSGASDAAGAVPLKEARVPQEEAPATPSRVSSGGATPSRGRTMDEDDDNLELFGSSSVFNESPSSLKSRTPR
jgi:hypothetical protein